MCGVPVLLRDTADGSTAGPTASFSMYMHGPGSYNVPRSANAITCSPDTQIHVMMLLESFQFQKPISQQESDARWEMPHATCHIRFTAQELFLLCRVTAIRVQSHMNVEIDIKTKVCFCLHWSMHTKRKWRCMTTGVGCALQLRHCGLQQQEKCRPVGPLQYQPACLCRCRSSLLHHNRRR
jgi:hypothetical protein